MKSTPKTPSIKQGYKLIAKSKNPFDKKNIKETVRKIMEGK